MSRVLIIGAGGVGNVMAKKCAQFSDTFTGICIASRTESKCTAIASDIPENIPVETAALDANDSGSVELLIRSLNAEIVLNAALPLQNLPIMEACLAAGAHYVDTSAPEPDPDKYEMFAYRWQREFHDRFAAKGIMGLLSLGFDPGVTNVYCAYAVKHLFDEIHTLNILDCNGGDHGHSFATNFNSITNIQEVTQPAIYWKEGEWVEAPAFSVKQIFDFQQIGKREMFLMYHEEMETLVEHLPGLKEMRFWMHFSDEHLSHVRVLQNVGLTSVEAVEHNGTKVRPLEFLHCLLPDPASLGHRYDGMTNIGCLFEGSKDGSSHRCYLYNVCEHTKAFDEVGSQAVSYTTGVPAVLGAKLLLDGTWKKPGVFMPEQLDPDPFMSAIGDAGLPWMLEEDPNMTN
jgi:saccharopine dehydrogenase (NAD+, L-lysine-forming)